MPALMQYYAFNVIREITLSKRFGFMEEDGDKEGIFTAIDKWMTNNSIFRLIPKLY